MPSGSRLRATELPTPRPGPGEVLLQVRACAVCRTDLHVVDGELPHPKLPLVPGHEIVGVVTARGEGVERFKLGDRVGVPWLGWTCGACEYCRSGPGESVRPGALHRLYPGWRICRIHRRRPAILFSHTRILLRRRGGSAALRGTDWLPVTRARPARPGGSGFTALARRRTSSRKWRAFRDARFTRSRAGATGKGRGLPCRWARCGRGIPRLCRRRNSMRRSSSPRRVNWFRWRSRRLPKVARSSAAAFT